MAFPRALSSSSPSCMLVDARVSLTRPKGGLQRAIFEDEREEEEMMLPKTFFSARLSPSSSA